MPSALSDGRSVSPLISLTEPARSVGLIDMMTLRLVDIHLCSLNPPSASRRLIAFTKSAADSSSGKGSLICASPRSRMLVGGKTKST